MDLDKYEGLDSQLRNGLITSIKGSLKLTPPISDHYTKTEGISRPREPMSSIELVRRWLDNDEGYTLSRYREWIKHAENFMSGIKYSKVEHTDLLVRSFTVYMQRQG